MNSQIDFRKASGILLFVVLAVGFFVWRSANQSSIKADSGKQQIQHHIKPGGPSMERSLPANSMPGVGK